MLWIPTLPFGDGPRYLQIVAALDHDIKAGLLAAGQRLPTHRDIANALRISVGTASKAYAEAERRGLINGEVGRGTFVSARLPKRRPIDVSDGPKRINLSLNSPPSTGEVELIAKTMNGIMGSSRLPQLLHYLPHQGREDHRDIMADWLTTHALPVRANQLYVTHGAQHAISIALRLIAHPGATVVTENLTYSGLLALSMMEGYVLRGVTMDAHGLIPEKLDEAFRETGAKVLYCTPTLQSASAALMPAERRREIAEIILRHDAYVVEDDAYGFLCDPPVATLSSMLPERSFYIVSFAKCLSPGLRIGVMVAPPEFRDRAVNAIRSTGWMANAIMAEVVVRMIGTGELDEQILRKRWAAATRLKLARELMGEVLRVYSETPAFHVWMQLPEGRGVANLISQAAQAGITISSPSMLHPFDSSGNGIRLCLGMAESVDDLGHALTVLRAILNDAEMMFMV